MKRRKSKREFSKRVAAIILVVALFDIQLCILSTFLGKEIPTEIGVALITEIVGVFITYCLKAYFGKKAEEDIRLREENENGLD